MSATKRSPAKRELTRAPSLSNRIIGAVGGAVSGFLTAVYNSGKRKEDVYESSSPLPVSKRRRGAARETEGCEYHTCEIRLNKNVWKVAKTPSSWTCSVCAFTNGTWCCLDCGDVRCEEHFVQHTKASCHFFAVEINKHVFRCFSCLENVDVTPSMSEGVAFLSVLKAVQAAKATRVSTTRSGRLLALSEKGAVVQPIEYDERLINALLHWRHMHMWRAFNAWRVCVLRKTSPRARKELPDTTVMKPKSDSSPGKFGTVMVAAKTAVWCSRAKTLVSQPRLATYLIPGLQGLVNLGNTCFMNSVIQCLSNIPSFRKLLSASFGNLPPQPPEPPSPMPSRSPRLRREPSKQSVINEKGLGCSTSELLSRMWSTRTQRTVVAPNALLKEVWRHMPVFKGYHQQDAQEFFSQFIDSLKKPTIAALFTLNVAIGWECPSCGQKSKQTSPDALLQLDLPASSLPSSARRRDPYRLLDMLHAYFEPSKVDGYKCDKCKKLVSVNRTSTIEKFPEVLVLQIKRFCWTARGAAKISRAVDFPLHTLELGKYGQHSSQRNTYDLVALVSHHGARLDAGHYTAVCYHSECRAWYHFNDTFVTPMDPAAVANVDPYLMFYVRR